MGGIIRFALKALSPFVGILGAYQGVKQVGKNLGQDIFGSQAGIVFSALLIGLILVFYLPGKVSSNRNFSGIVSLFFVAFLVYGFSNRDKFSSLFVMSKARALEKISQKKSLTVNEILTSGGYELNNDKEYVLAINDFISNGSLNVALKLIDAVNLAVINDNGGILITTIKFKQYELLQILMSRLGLVINNQEHVGYTSFFSLAKFSSTCTPLKYALSGGDAKATKILYDAYKQRGIKLPYGDKVQAERLINKQSN